MLVGSDGILHNSYADHPQTEQICSAALIFIMFYVGFNLNWKETRLICAKAVLLSTLGVLIVRASVLFWSIFFLTLNAKQPF